MANNRPGYGVCFVEMPDELLSLLAVHCATSGESRACVVNKAVSAYLKKPFPIERLCPVRGRQVKDKSKKKAR